VCRADARHTFFLLTEKEIVPSIILLTHPLDPYYKTTLERWVHSSAGDGHPLKIAAHGAAVRFVGLLRGKQGRCYEKQALQTGEMPRIHRLSSLPEIEALRPKGPVKSADPKGHTVFKALAAINEGKNSLATNSAR
jgi:hypothetical protein